MIPRTEAARALRLMSQMILDPPGNMRILLNPHGSAERVIVMAFASPPVPANLREMLKDYPELIERLREALISVNTRSTGSLPPFEDAVWKLEDCLDSFINDAQAELTAAKASGDAELISATDGKFKLMFRARSGNGGMKGLHELRDYFKESEKRR